MKPLFRKLVLMSLFTLSASATAADVIVKYMYPDKFTDLPLPPSRREEVLNGLSEHFGELGANLPASQKLVFEVVDIDMAGRNFGDMREVEGLSDWPSVKFRYFLMENGKVLKRGHASVSDMSYLLRFNRPAETDLLRHEKHMIDKWFAETILAKRPG